ncbi:zinc finger BED domain-containing protein RICESLEEPER 2-like [Wolffia australiana]
MGSELVVAKRRPRSAGGGGGATFDQDRSIEDLAKMIAMHEYPLNTVDHPAFAAFVLGLQPRFRLPTFSSIEAQIITIFNREKQALRRALTGLLGRVSLAVGLWTTAQTLGYVSLTAHFVGRDWKLCRRTLSFTMVGSPHSEAALGDVVGFVLADWALHGRLFAVALDGTHQINGSHLCRHVKTQIFTVRCFTQMLGLIARDLLASIHGIVYSVRESVKYIKASPDRDSRFAEIAGPEYSGLKLDIPARWESTYEMLVAAGRLRATFAECELGPAPEEWVQAEAVCSCLKLCFDSTAAVAAATTANLFFQEAWRVQVELAHAARCGGAARDAKDKFEQYWKDCSLAMAVAVVMDPRYKLKLVEFCFARMYGRAVESHVGAVNATVQELFADYGTAPSAAVPTDFDAYVAAVEVGSKSELDQYLEEALVPRGEGFEVLEWWKVNGPKYPILAKMARDILAVPMSTVHVGAIFGSGGGDGGGRKVDDYRSSLRPETVEALVCTKDWLQHHSTFSDF